MAENEQENVSEYDVEIACWARPEDWTFLAGPFLSQREAAEYIDWQREIDAKPPRGRYWYRIAKKPTEQLAPAERDSAAAFQEE